VDNRDRNQVQRQECRPGANGRAPKFSKAIFGFATVCGPRRRAAAVMGDLSCSIQGIFRGLTCPDRRPCFFKAVAPTPKIIFD